MKYVIFAQAAACLVLVTSVLLLIWLSDHTEPKPPKADEQPPKLPHGRHARPGHDERFAETADLPAVDDATWFHSLKEPRKPPRPVDLTRDVIPAPVFDPEYAPAPVWPTLWHPIIREPIPEHAPALKPLPEPAKRGEPCICNDFPEGPNWCLAREHEDPAIERPVPAEPAAASECEAGTGPPAGELDPWVAEALRGTDSILDSIVARRVVPVP